MIKNFFWNEETRYAIFKIITNYKFKRLYYILPTSKYVHDLLIIILILIAVISIPRSTCLLHARVVLHGCWFLDLDLFIYFFFNEELFSYSLFLVLFLLLSFFFLFFSFLFVSFYFLLDLQIIWICRECFPIIDWLGLIPKVSVRLLGGECRPDSDLPLNLKF